MTPEDFDAAFRAARAAYDADISAILAERTSAMAPHIAARLARDELWKAARDEAIAQGTDSHAAHMAYVAAKRLSMDTYLSDIQDIRQRTASAVSEAGQRYAQAMASISAEYWEER